MDEDPETTNSYKNGNITNTEDELDEIKDFVFKHLKEVTDQSNRSLQCEPGERSIEGTPCPTSTNTKVLKKSPCKNAQGAVFSGKILSFSCSVCKDDLMYSPNDLLKHFRGSHKESLPTYPCDLCGFVTNEFPALQRHRIGHRNTLVTCEICNDDVQYSLLLLTRHYIMCHSLNGHFHCEKCEFTTLDAGTFVQHIHHHNKSRLNCYKCHHVSLNKEEHQRHMKVHSTTFTCQSCGYSTTKGDNLTKHMINVHSGETGDRKSLWRAVEDSNTMSNSSASLKLLLKKSPALCGETKDSQWVSKMDSLSAILPNKNGRLLKSEKAWEESRFDNIEIKNNKNWNQLCHNTEQQIDTEATSPAQPVFQEYENCSPSDIASHNNPNGLTVLMVKNKISLPPNCTTKVIGLKMVDGKKHLVLKVMPTTKVDSHTQNLSQIDDLGSAASDVASNESKESLGEYDNDCLTFPCLAASQKSSSNTQAFQDDIMAVKVKVEEEEIPLSECLPAWQRDECREQTEPEENILNPVARKGDDFSEHNYSPKTKHDLSSIPAHLNSERINTKSPMSSPNNIDSTCHSKEHQDSLPPKQILGTCRAANWTVLPDTAVDLHIDGHMEDDGRLAETSPEKTVCVDKEINSYSAENKSLSKSAQRCSNSPSANLSPQSEPHSAILKGDPIWNSPNQEVFSFHNYSKETFNTSDTLAEISTDSDGAGGQESSQWSLTLAESPEPCNKSGIQEDTDVEASQHAHGEDMEAISEKNIEVDECVASVDDQSTEEEASESIFQDFNIIKVEEENIPVCAKQLESRNSSTFVSHMVEDHADAIITHTLNKERVATSADSSDSGKPTKTTLRILQMPEGKKQMLFQTVENHCTTPLQLKGNPGFKLITKSSSPQINVSYLKPGFERSCQATSQCEKTTSIGMSKPILRTSEMGTTSLSGLQPGVSTISSHYIINSTGLKGPVLVSNAANGSQMDKTLKPQQTCYLVQRSLPIVKAPGNVGFKLASSQGPLGSRSILAMPVNHAEKKIPLQTGRQAYLVRYVSQPKSGILLSNAEGQAMTQSKKNSESTGSKVLFKIVTPTSGLFTSGAPTSTNHPLFLSTKPQTQCFLVSNKSNGNASSRGKKLIPVENAVAEHIKVAYGLSSQPNLSVNVKQYEGEKLHLAPRPIRPPSQRKRRRKQLFDELPVSVHKARRLANKTLTERETPVLWQPVAKDIEGTLRLSPFSPLQQVKCPRRNQPVVVLNHPDADIPEVMSIMKSVNRYRGAVTKVSLSHQTVQALSVLNDIGELGKSLTKGLSPPRPRPVQSSVRERFLLKLKLKKKSKKKYEVVKAVSRCADQPSFDCWFCGRLFNSQEDWIGHGQRHLMEATRDWNKFF